MGLNTKIIDGSLDATISAAGNKTAIWGGVATTIYGWFQAINWVSAAGIFAAVAGLGLNIYFSARRDRREQRESDARIAAIQREFYGDD